MLDKDEMGDRDISSSHERGEEDEGDKNLEQIEKPPDSGAKKVEGEEKSSRKQN